MIILNIDLMIGIEGPVVSAPRRAIAEVKQHGSVIGWVTKNLLYRAPPCLASRSDKMKSH
jgi:hypothetical protein